MQEFFDQYINYLTAEKNASRYTVRNYTSDLMGGRTEKGQKGFFQYLRLQGIETLNEVNRQVIRDYISWLMEQGVVKSSIARKMSAIRSVFNYLVRESIMDINPLERVISPKRDRRLPAFLSINETVKLIKAPDTSTPTGLRDRAILELLYASGVRVSELVSLNLNQVNLSTNEIRVRGKGSKERIVLIGKPAASAIQAYLSNGRPQLLGDRNHSAMFISRQGERLIERRVQKILEKYGKAAGISQRIHPHMLRHTFATHMLDGGADLRVVQELLGHADLSSTQIYTQVSKAQARKVYLSAHPLAKAETEEKGGQDESPT